MKAGLLAALSVFVLILAGCASGKRNFLYMVGPSTNEVFAFESHSDGHITRLGAPTFATGSGPASLGVHPIGDFMYIANSAGNNITLLDINKGNGELTVPPVNAALPPSPLAPPNIFAAGGSPISIAISPNSPHVYVLNQTSGDISAFLLDPSNGNLALITNPPGNGPTSTPTFGSFTQPAAMAISPKGDFLFVASPSQASIFAFAVNQSDGSLGQVGAPISLGTGATPTAVAVHPSGKFVYVTDLAHNAVAAFSNQAGQLAPISGSPFAAGTQPSAVTTDAGGVELFVANAGSNDVSAFVIDANTGALGPVNGSPFASGGRGPGVIAASGAFVYVADQVTNDIDVYSIQSNGSLTPVSGSPFNVPTSPTWLSLVSE